MHLMLTIIVFLYIHLNLTVSKVIITRYDDECDISEDLIEEISSYKSVVERIKDEVFNSGFGDLMYERYSSFIDKFGARVSGSDTLERAIEFMVNLTEEEGVTDVFTEEVTVPHWVRALENLQMISPYPKQMALIGLGSSISSPYDGIIADAIVVKSFDELEKLSSKEVKGKIVVYDVPYVSYGNTVVYRSQGATKASMKGAIASLVRSITPFSLYTPHTGTQHYDGNVTKIPTAAITHEDADLIERLTKSGVKVTLNLTMFNSFDVRKSRNTIVDLKGNKNPEKTVIVSGHIDSWDVGQGAMDDGGGMWISWMAPILLKRLNLSPKRTVRAILWTAEEPGLVGAFAYLMKHEKELSKINFIMESDEGTFNPRGLTVAGSKSAKCLIAAILKHAFSPIDKMTETDYPGSDIVVMVQKGVPGASLINDNEKYYWYHHTNADTMDVQNKTDVLKCAAFWSAVSYVIADLSKDVPRI